MLKTGKENCSGLTHLTSNRVVCGYKQIYPNKVRQFFFSHTLTHLRVTLVSPSSLCEPAGTYAFVGLGSAPGRAEVFLHLFTGLFTPARWNAEAAALSRTQPSLNRSRGNTSQVWVESGEKWSQEKYLTFYLKQTATRGVLKRNFSKISSRIPNRPIPQLYNRNWNINCMNSPTLFLCS